MFEELTEKELKYELFRAIRTKNTALAIDLLKDHRVNINWQHSYKQWSVLLHAYFEHNEELFKYLVSRSDLDLSLLDDEGHDIYYWLSISSEGPNFKSMLVDARGTILDKLKNKIDTKLNAIQNQEITEQYRQMEQSKFELLLNAKYKVLKSCHGLMQNQIVQYTGITLTPGDHCNDTNHNFKVTHSHSISILADHLPRTYQESFAIFEDVFQIPESAPKHISEILKKLQHRSHFVREEAAQNIDPKLAQIHLIIPCLTELAINCSKIQNHFTNALIKLNPDSTQYIEQLPESDNESMYGKLLANLGSKKFLQKYLNDISSGQFTSMRYAIERLGEIADPTTNVLLESLSQHNNYNIRTSATEALKLAKQNQTKL